MSTVLAAAARTDEPLRRVLAFSRRFGRETTALAMHAALPLGLSPELVHLLRVNFVPRAPFIAEADLLLSALCAEAGGGMYEMDADVRELLLAEMARTPGYGPAQQRRVADFLRLWAARALDDTADPDLQEHLRVQQWVALAYADPARAAEELAGALRAGVERADRPEVARVARLTTVLSAPLAAEVELRRYAGAVERMAATGAAASSGSGAVSIGRERLPSMDRVVRLWHPQPTPDIQQQSNVANDPAIQQQANVGDEPILQQQAIVADEPVVQQQTAEHVEPAGYRVARVLVFGDNAVGKSALISRITGRDLRSRGGAGSDYRRWSVGRRGDEERDIVFVDPPAEGILAIEMAEAAALVLVVGPHGRDTAEGWLRRTGGTQPVFVVESSSAENPPSVPSDLVHLTKEARVAGVFSVNVRTGHGVGELKDPLVRVIDWSRTAASTSRAELDALEQLLEARFGSSPVAEFGEKTRSELAERLRFSHPGLALSHTVECLDAREFVRVIGDPPRAVIRTDAYARCVGEIWRIVASDDQHPPGLPSVVYHTLEERFSTSGLRDFLSGDPAHRVLDLVLEDLTRRRWAFRVDSRDGRQVVIPSQFRAAPMSTEPPISDLRPVLQARWPGTLNDVFVLQLVNFANLGRVDVHAPDRAYVRLSDGLLRVDGSVSDGIAQLNLAASRDAADATVRDLFRFVMTWYLPGVAVEFTAMDSTPPDADTAVPQEAEEAAPSGGTPPASPGMLEPPTGVDLERACLVVLPFGTKQVGERVIDFDAVWEHLFKPAIGDLRLTKGEPLVPLRITELPEPGSPLPDWMKAALLVLVDLTGADAGRIEALGMMPGHRTQHVLLFQEIYDPPRGIADDQVNGYAYGGPEELAGQRALLSQRLAETLGVPGGGTGDGTATFVVTADALNVRRGPGSEHPVVANLSKGTRVERLEAADGWLRIQTPDGITGWISARFAAPESAQHAEPPLGKVRVTAGTLNLRAGPGTGHPVIMALPQGMVLDRLGVSADERWTHVRSPDDFQGWAASRFVEDVAPEPMFMAAFAPPAAAPGETIQVRMLVYEASAKQKADRHLGQMGADFGDIEWGPALGGVSPGARLEMRFTADWLSEPEWTYLDWRGGWLSSAATLEIPVDREQGEGSVLLEVLADGVLVGQMSVMLRIERPATVPKDDAPAARIDLRTAYAAYAPEDRERARARLAAITSAVSLDVFVDELPETSDEGQRRVMDEVASRDVFLLLYSPAAARSNAVQRDWWKAITSNLATGKPEIQVHLLEPVPLEEIPSELRDFQIIPPPDRPDPGPKADPTRFP